VSIALANVGTPLASMMCGHLLVLNLVISVIEAWCLSRWLRVPFGRAIGWMLGANYVSALAGFLLVPVAYHHLVSWRPQTPALYFIGTILIVSALAALLLTIVIESPFVLAATRGLGPSVRRRLAFGAAAQGVSYVLLAAAYLSASRISVLTRYERVRTASDVVSYPGSRIYFIDDRDGWVWASDLDGGNTVRVVEVIDGRERGIFSDGLWLRKGEGPTVDLMYGSANRSECLLRSIPGVAGDRALEQHDDGPAKYEPPDFRPVDGRTSSWYAFGLSDYGIERQTPSAGLHTTTDYRLALSTPLLSWRAAYPTILPGGEVLFEFGDQIMVMDERRRLAAISWGQSPVVVMPASATPVPQ